MLILIGGGASLVSSVGSFSSASGSLCSVSSVSSVKESPAPVSPPLPTQPRMRSAALSSSCLFPAEEWLVIELDCGACVSGPGGPDRAAAPLIKLRGVLSTLLAVPPIPAINCPCPCCPCCACHWSGSALLYMGGGARGPEAPEPALRAPLINDFGVCWSRICCPGPRPASLFLLVSSSRALDMRDLMVPSMPRLISNRIGYNRCLL